MEKEATWGELLGSKDWEGLRDPLDINLRRLILTCGDLCQVTYDSFNNDANSKYAGSCRYGKASLFKKVMFDDAAAELDVAAYLYATAQVSAVKAFFLRSLSREEWDRETNWMGYVAVTNDAVSRARGRREIYVVFRGTTTNYEWINAYSARPTSAEALLRPKSLNDDDDDDGDDNIVPKVMFGWLTLYSSKNPNSAFTKLSLREQLQAKIKQLRDQYKGEDLSIIVTGHSLGASLAILAAFDLCESGIVTSIPLATIVFGSPQVGNRAFNQALSQHSNLKILHVRNRIDLIPEYPGPLLGFRKSGIELVIDHRKSPDLKASMYTGDWHNLQGMLHVVAGWAGDDGEFEMKVERCVALVNKSCGFLKDELLIPESWWVEKNKSMVRDENGKWGLASPNDEDLPVREY